MKPIKKIVIAKNFNNKLQNNFFIHLVKIAGLKITYAKLGESIIEWSTEDDSINTVKTECFDYQSFTVQNLPPIFCWLSHGISKSAFITNYNLKNDDIIAMFYYIKI